MRIWRILFLIITNIVTKTLSCTTTAIGKINGYDEVDLLCQSMTLTEYQQEIDPILNNYYATYINIIQINMSIIDNYAFPHNYYRYTYSLTIKQCGVTTIESNSFNKFTGLHYLLIVGNNIKYLSGDFLAPLTTLQSLDISSNNIQHFHINCNNIVGFTELIISNNSITSITDNKFHNCFYLLFLNISNNKFNTMTNNEFSDIENIQTIDLSNSKISNIEQKTFHGLNNLKNLYLHNNNLTICKAHIFEGLENLESLDLSNLNITEIEPETFQSLNKLQNLNLQNNSIGFLHANILLGLNSLINLNLNSNNLQEFPCGIFQEHNVISSLDVSNNELESISACAFQHLVELRSLDLAHNRLRSLGMSSMSALVALQTLNLSDNALVSVSEATLHPLEELQLLDISVNRFSHLEPSSLLGHLTHLRQVDLSGNPWACQNLTLIRKHLHARGVTYTARIRNFTATNIGGIQCVQHAETTTSNNQSNETTQLANDLSQSVVLKTTQNTNFEKLTNIVSNIYILHLSVIVIYVCFKSGQICYKLYTKNKKKRKLTTTTDSNTRTQLISLNTDSDTV